jgi:hypothetical protein
MILTKCGLRCLSLLLTLGGLDARSREPDLEVDVLIYNYSTVSKATLTQAEHVADEILQAARVKIVWLDCPVSRQEAARNRTCAPSRAHPRLQLQVLTNSMADALETSKDTFGLALLPANASFGTVAYVYADRARLLAEQSEFDVILGRVIAHELGHLLLGNNSHSAVGIMKALWHTRDLEPTREASMYLVPIEAKKIHAQVLARIGGTSTLPKNPSADLECLVHQSSSNNRGGLAANEIPACAEGR